MQTRDEKLKLLRWAFDQGNKYFANPSKTGWSVRAYAIFVGRTTKNILDVDPAVKPYGGTREEVTEWANDLIKGEFDAELAELFKQGCDDGSGT